MRTMLVWYSASGDAEGRGWRVSLGGEIHDVSDVDTRGCSARCVLRPREDGAPRAVISLRTRHDRRWRIDGDRVVQEPVEPEARESRYPPPARGTHAWLREQTEAAIDAFVRARSHALRCPSRHAWRAVASLGAEAQHAIARCARAMDEEVRWALDAMEAADGTP